MSTPGLLGVDGGGTSTTAWLADVEGRVLGRGIAGPSNIKTVGAEAARLALELAITSAFMDAKRRVEPVAIACLGLAGFDRIEDKKWLSDWAISAAWSGRLLLVNDGDLVVAAGTPGGWGVGLIAGTGSIAVGKRLDGSTARAGGWGPLFGDEGSGYAVALAGLRRVAQVADGRRLATTSFSDPLTARLCQALGVEKPEDLIAAVYRDGVDRARIASLARAVTTAAEDDLSIVAEILEPAGIELASMVAAVARKLEMDTQPVPLAMAGSFLLNAPQVSHALIHHLIEQGFVVRPTTVPEPVKGALVLARKALATS